jgi:hypothetical protein
MKKQRDRECIRRQHEAHVIKEFGLYLNQNQNDKFHILAQPDPPDAIIKNSQISAWIEHTQIFRSSEEAKEVYSSITPNEKPFKRNFLIVEPDQRIANALFSSAYKKTHKPAYKDCSQNFGIGILLLDINDPLFDSHTLARIQNNLESDLSYIDDGYFDIMYLSIRTGNGYKFIKYLERVSLNTLPINNGP